MSDSSPRPMLASLVALALAAGCQPSDAVAPGPAAGEASPDAIVAGGACANATGAGTTHAGTVSADEVWTAAASPHRVPNAISVLAQVTIEACATVIVADGVTISVGDTSTPGRIVARGTGAGADVRPVVFRAAEGASAWGGLSVQAKGSVDLAFVALVDGGASGDGALVSRGVAGGTNSGPMTENLSVDHVVIEKSRSYGVNLLGWGAFTAGSSKLWIRGSGSPVAPSAVRLELGVASTLPTSLVAVGNLKDEVVIAGPKPFMRDDTLVSRGLPYRAVGPIRVAGAVDGPAVTLKIEAGVTLGFDEDAGSGMVVGSSPARPGVLDAVGTDAAPIVFTSGRPTKAPGDWTNLTFKTPTFASRVSHARVEYAGASSQTRSFGCGPADNDAAVLVLVSGPDEAGPVAAFIDATTFDSIAGTTVIVSGWVDDAGPNLSAGNTFGAATPACKVSRPRRKGAGDVCDGGRTTCW